MAAKVDTKQVSIEGCQISLVCSGHDVIMQTSNKAKPKSAQASKGGVCGMAAWVIWLFLYT